MRQARLLLAPALAAVLAACVHTPAPAYQPGVDNLRALRAGPATPLAVGDFDAGPKVDDERLGGLRGSSMSGAEDGLFSTYLQRALEAELRQAGRLDPEADLRLEGTLVRNQLSTLLVPASDEWKQLWNDTADNIQKWALAIAASRN